MAVIVLLAGMGTSPAIGHDFSLTDTRIELGPDHQFVVEMICDLDALLLGRGSGHDPEAIAEELSALPRTERVERVEKLLRLFERRVRVRFDGQRVPFEVSFPDSNLLDRSSIETAFGGGGGSPTAGTVARLQGHWPEDARELTFFASRSFRAVRLSVYGTPGPADLEAILQPGEESPVYRIRSPSGIGGPDRRQTTWVEVGTDYLVLGFRHILPLGGDHILFVLALFFLSPRVDRLLWQVSAFTVAHTLTLALSVLGFFHIPGHIVEPLIAASIALVAIQNLFTQELRAHRLWLVFGLGLLHGLGFGGVLNELGLPHARLLLGLLSFNVGVELGQVAVLAGALLAFGFVSSRDWYRKVVVVPASAALAACGSMMLVSRLFF